MSERRWKEEQAVSLPDASFPAERNPAHVGRKQRRGNPLKTFCGTFWSQKVPKLRDLVPIVILSNLAPVGIGGFPLSPFLLAVNFC